MAPPEYVTNLAFSVPSFIFVLSQKKKILSIKLCMMEFGLA